jgi:hypothetical protein
MTDLMQALRFAIVVTTAVILVGFAAMELQDKFAGQVRANPIAHPRAVFDRDFDFDTTKNSPL